MIFFTNVPAELSPEWCHEHMRPLFSRHLVRDEAYFACHSLGRPLDRMEQDVVHALSHWYEAMDGAWSPWFDEIEVFCKSVAQLINWSGEVVPKTSCGQALRTVLNSFDKPPVVVASRGEFDSIDFILKVYESKGRLKVRWVEPREGIVPTYHVEDYLPLLEGADMLVTSAVFFGTGQVLVGINELIQIAKEQELVTVVDTYHAAGVLEVPLDNADFAIGGSYKYVRGGPGACWLAISSEMLGRRTLDTGWFAKKDPFAYARPEPLEFGHGKQAWMESTPAVLPIYQAKAGMELACELGVPKVRSATLRILEDIRESVPFMYRPKNASEWGGYALLPHPRANEFSARMRSEFGVNTDARKGLIRFGPDLLTSHEDIRRASRAVSSLMAIA